MAKKSSKIMEAVPSNPVDYDHRISMHRKDGQMRMSHEMPMGKDKKATEKTVKMMIDKMFASAGKK